MDCMSNGTPDEMRWRSMWFGIWVQNRIPIEKSYPPLIVFVYLRSSSCYYCLLLSLCASWLTAMQELVKYRVISCRQSNGIIYWPRDQTEAIVIHWLEPLSNCDVVVTINYNSFVGMPLFYFCLSLLELSSYPTDLCFITVSLCLFIY